MTTVKDLTSNANHAGDQLQRSVNEVERINLGRAVILLDSILRLFRQADVHGLMDNMYGIQKSAAMVHEL